VSINDRIMWNRNEDGNKLDIEEIKSRIRDIVAPKKDLGFDFDMNQDDENEPEIDDEEAAGMRNYFGVL